MKIEAIPAMVSMIPSVVLGVVPDDLARINEIVRQAFPTVHQISTETLAEWISDGESTLLLIDVRSPEEFAVSHLRSAVNLRTTADIAGAITEQRPTRTVLYCSVGFRSSRLAHQLAQECSASVSNLEGSIFQWVNEGREVYQGDKLTLKAHPFGKRWAGLLKPGLASGS